MFLPGQYKPKQEQPKVERAKVRVIKKKKTEVPQEEDKSNEPLV